MFPIYIPSRGRATERQQTTLAQIPFEILHRVYLVVPYDEHDDYCEIANDLRVGILSWPNVNGINATRRAIGIHAEESNESHFMMFDDDLKFFRRRSSEDTRLVELDDSGYLWMIDACQDLFNLGYGAVGVSARQGNNRLEWPLVENTRMIRTLGFETELFNSCEHDRVDVMEDFDVLLQILRKGRDMAVLSSFSQDQGMTQASGGCSTYRTHELHDASARKLAELHPEFVKLRQKVNKTGGDFGTRTEVTISWKKARASSPKARIIKCSS